MAGSLIERRLTVGLRLRTVHPTGNLMFIAGRVDYAILEVSFFVLRLFRS